MRVERTQRSSWWIYGFGGVETGAVAFKVITDQSGWRKTDAVAKKKSVIERREIEGAMWSTTAILRGKDDRDE